jgi:hypothetical protein
MEMFHNIGTRNSAFRFRTQVWHLVTSRRLAKCSKHSQKSIWVQWSRMDASQLRYPETVYSGPKHKFCIFLPVEGLRNAPKHSQTSFWVKWSRMDASQLWHPETVYSSPKQKFCIFVPVEGYRNAPKHSQTSFGSNGVEQMLHNFDTTKQCIQARNTSFTSLYLSKVIETLRNTPKHHFGSNGVEWMLHNFDTPKQCIQARNTSFTSCYLLKVSEMLWNTPKHHFGSNGSQHWYPK